MLRLLWLGSVGTLVYIISTGNLPCLNPKRNPKLLYTMYEALNIISYHVAYDLALQPPKNETFTLLYNAQIRRPTKSSKFSRWLGKITIT